VKIAACQVSPIHNDLRRAVSLVASYASDAERRGARLVCFPECFLQGYDVRVEHAAEAAIDLTSSEFAHIGGEKSVFEAGTDYPVFEVDGTKVGMNICYDLNFSEAIMAVANAGAELVACPCNNMMRRRAAEECKLRHNEIRAERAREGSVWLISSDVTGDLGERTSYGPTAVISPSGTVVDQVPLMTTGMVVAEIGQDRTIPSTGSV
jgi:predicted amidohydrolase